MHELKISVITITQTAKNIKHRYSKSKTKNSQR